MLHILDNLVAYTLATFSLLGQLFGILFLKVVKLFDPKPKHKVGDIIMGWDEIGDLRIGTIVDIDLGYDIRYTVEWSDGKRKRMSELSVNVFKKVLEEETQRRL